MAKTSVMRLPFNAPKPTRFFVAPRIGGFPAYFLGSSFRFDDANLAQGLLDDVSGSRFALTTGGGGLDSAALAPNGGLQLKGKASLIGPLMDVINPFTMILAATVARPVADEGYEAMSFGDFPTRGGIAWLTAANPVPADNLHSANFWQSDRGNVGSGSLNFTQTPTPYVAKFTTLEFLILAHKGNGLIRLEQRRGGAVSRIDFQGNNTYWLGATASPQGLQTIRVGSFASGFVGRNGMIAEAFGFYNRDLTVAEADIQAWIDNATQVVAARGRL